MGNRIQVEGKDGASNFLSYLKDTKKTDKLILDPCQSYVNYKHAKYMANSNCIMHYEHYDGAKPIAPAKEKCNSAVKTKTKLLDWRQRALRHGNFKSGVELVGVMNGKFVFNPKLFVCMLALSDNDPKRVGRKALFNKKYHNLAVGLFKKGDDIFYSVSLTDWSTCNMSVRDTLLGKKKMLKAWSPDIDKDFFKKFAGDNSDFKKKMDKEAEKRAKKCGKSLKKDKSKKDKKSKDKKKDTDKDGDKKKDSKGKSKDKSKDTAAKDKSKDTAAKDKKAKSDKKKKADDKKAADEKKAADDKKTKEKKDKKKL